MTQMAAPDHHITLPFLIVIMRSLSETILVLLHVMRCTLCNKYLLISQPANYFSKRFRDHEKFLYFGKVRRAFGVLFVNE